MDNRTFNYVRSLRRRHALTELELGCLIDVRSRGTIWAYESGESAPKLERAFALQVVFGATPSDIFLGVYEGIEDRVMREALEFYKSLEGKTDARSAVKRRLLEEMAARNGGATSDDGV